MRLLHLVGKMSYLAFCVVSILLILWIPLAVLGKVDFLRQYPSRIWVEGDDSQKCVAMRAAAYWESEIFSRDEQYSCDVIFQGQVFFFVEKREEADVVIVIRISSFSYFERGALCSIPESSDGRTCYPILPFSPRIILIRDDPQEPFTINGLQSVLLHEMGHAVLGLVHSSDINSIMYPGGGSWGRASDEDIVLARKYLRQHSVSVP